MVFPVVASLAILAGAVSVSASVGDAVVHNSCDYPVYVRAVPASGGGHVAQDPVAVSPGESWSHEWTVLSPVNGGWSLKIGKTYSDVMNNGDTMQYEYTLKDLIWWDMSCVNGCPWSDWDLSSNNPSCQTKDTSYQNPTDDANGMQKTCDADTNITLNLCSNDAPSSGGSSGAAPSSYTSSAAAAPAPAPSSSESSESSESSSKSGGGLGLLSIGGIGNVLQAAEHVATTLATTTSAAPAAAEPAITDAPAADNVVTHVDIAYVTEVVTAYANSRVKRHQHHAHGHQHQG